MVNYQVWESGATSPDNLTSRTTEIDIKTTPDEG